MRLAKRADKSGDAPAEGESWPLSHVEIIDIGDKQNLTPEFVARARAEGWLETDGDTITIHAEPDDVVLDIVRVPGLYCCHCGEQQFSAAEAQEHVASTHKGKESPDAQNPSGYRDDRFYACEAKKGK